VSEEQSVSTTQLPEVSGARSDEELVEEFIDEVCRVVCMHLSVRDECGLFGSVFDPRGVWRRLCERVIARIKDRCVEFCKELFSK